ncbi:MAG TPA: DUF2336 domain-containing protein [Microvirga sp.]|nr:DUF2336 domain-containing protein [Microvirga sp.]
MHAVRRLMHDLEETISVGSPERRETTLWRVTDLLLVDIEKLTEEQIGIFDDVIARLAQAIESEVRAELARRLAPVDKAPPRLMRSLAHDAIEVARPVLAQSRRLDDGDLIAVALSHGPEHRQAIAERPFLAEPVTDTLLSRADRPILHTLAANAGARFSREGARVLVDRARLDEELQILLKARIDLPKEQVERLFALAQDAARRSLAASTPMDLHPVMDRALARTTKRLRAVVAGPLDYGAAMDTIGAIEIGRPIDEEDVAGFVAGEQLEETICAVAACTSLSLEAAERLFTVADSDLLLILGKAKGWSWATLRALLALKDPDALEPQRLKRHAETFEDLDPQTAHRVLRFVQRRDRKA